MATQPFEDRIDAGRQLAAVLAGRVPLDAVVLALPRGGVEVAYQVARVLGVALDVMVVRKLGVPGHRELAMGAIAGGDVLVLNERVVQELGISTSAIEHAISEERDELRRREAAYRGGQGPLDIAGRAVILVDDGLATGATMSAAVRAARALGAGHITVAVPVGAADACQEMRALADEVVCLATPEPFDAVGLWYRHFPPTPDEEVIRLLALHASRES